jgi:hypothetical protein
VIDTEAGWEVHHRPTRNVVWFGKTLRQAQAWVRAEVARGHDRAEFIIGHQSRTGRYLMDKRWQI